jgi:hypothetical protein
MPAATAKANPKQTGARMAKRMQNTHQITLSPSNSE